MSTKSPSMIARWHPIDRKSPPVPSAATGRTPRASSRSGPSCFSVPSLRKRWAG